MSFSIFNRPWAQGLVIALSVLLVYSVSANAPFVWDDEVMIENNLLIRSWSNVGSLFTSSAFGASFSTDKFYRPLQMLSYMFDYSIWGLNPIGFRLTSIVLHLITSLLFLGILRKLKCLPIWAFFIALVYAIHPIHIESVTYLSGRGDALYLLCLMASFLCYLKSNKRSHSWVYRGLCIAAFVLAIFTKENSVTFPFSLAVFAWFSSPKVKKETWWTIATLTSISVLYILWRNPLAIVSNGVLSNIAEASLFERLLTGPYIVLTYLRLLVAPFPLHMEYHHVVTSIFSLWVIAFIVVCGGAFYYFKTEIKHPRFLAGAGWFLLALAPVSQILKPLASTIREHWLTFPSIGLFIWLALLLSDKKREITRTQLGIAISIAMVLGGISIHRNLDWRNPMTLYRHDAYYEPNSFVLLNNIGVIAFRAGDMTTAREYFLEAINVSPRNSYGTAHNNYGAVVERSGNISLAMYHYKKSIEYSHYELAYINFGRHLLRARKLEPLISTLEEGVRRYKNNHDMLYLLASGYYLNGEYQKAKVLYEKVQHLSPGFLSTESVLKKLNEL